ncbi:zinc finger MYM-type protein 1-like [Tachypleus tridentatus]|uniref:zinc finger MYM-type protein 1-like n=1 Tax=Tachypleus tridentatus TaxID=6853 RepID=UPI003FD1CBAE
MEKFCGPKLPVKQAKCEQTIQQAEVQQSGSSVETVGLSTASEGIHSSVGSKASMDDSLQAELIIPSKPNQPRNFQYPKRECKQFKRSFQPSWYEEFPWLHYIEFSDTVLCHTCLLAEKEQKLNAKYKESAFLRDGFSNWKKAREKFRDHQMSQCHKMAVENVIVLPKTCSDIGEMLDMTLREEKKESRSNMAKIIENLQFLSRQGLALQGHSDKESNFIQLYHLRAKDNSKMIEWLKKKTNKYVTHDVQNEILEVMALQVLRDVASCIRNGRYFFILAVECTDVANKEQLTICIRWIDDNLEPHEDFIGFYEISTINADTIVLAIKDAIIRMNLTLANCRGQCYDAGCPMAGSQRCVAEQVLKDAPKAHYTHCHGHALNLAVCDVTKGSKLLADTLDITYEICKLIKFSPKRQGLLDKIKADINLERAGLKVICPTRWTVHGQSFDRIIANYEALLLEWDVCLEDRLDSEMRARIIGVRSQMEKFEYFFALHLGVAVYSLTDNLSKTLQKTCMSAAQGQQNAKLVAGVLDQMRNDGNGAQHFRTSNAKTEERPKRFEVGTGEPSFPSSPKEFYRRQYFEVLDLVINAINRRFYQPGFQAYRHMEDLLLKSLREEDTPDELKYLADKYGDDLDILSLKAQLPLLNGLLRGDSEDRHFKCFNYIYLAMKQLKEPQRCLISEVIISVKLLLVNPSSNAVGERSFSTARRLKTWLRSTMNQSRVNSLAVLHIHKERTASSDLVSIANDFVQKNDRRKVKLGVFTEHDFAGGSCSHH